MFFFAWNQLPNLISIQNSDYDLIKLIRSLVNCEWIEMKPFHHELQEIKLGKLRWLVLNGSDSSIKITVICDYAFYQCNQIEEIHLMNNNINFVSKSV